MTSPRQSHTTQKNPCICKEQAKTKKMSQMVSKTRQEIFRGKKKEAPLKRFSGKTSD